VTINDVNVTLLIHRATRMTLSLSGTTELSCDVTELTKGKFIFKDLGITAVTKSDSDDVIPLEDKTVSDAILIVSRRSLVFHSISTNLESGN